MKKFLGILVLGLLWCNVGVAELIEFNKCFTKKPRGAFQKEANIVWNSWEEFNHDEISEYHNCKTCKKITTEDGWEKIVRLYVGPKYDDIVFSINPKNSTVTQLSILNDEWIKGMETYNHQFKTNDPEEYEHHFKIAKRAGQRFTTEPKKYNYEKYTITNFVGGIILAESINEYVGGRLALNIDLKNNQVDYRYYSADEKTLELFDRHDIYFCNKEETLEAGISSGTAFFINNKGNLLTNNHVVKECSSHKISYFSKEYDVKIIATDKMLDLALLKANVKPKSFISFSKDELKKRQQITAAGYPLGQFLSDDLKINDGRISALKGFENNSNEIQHDIPINPGNSGGPIVNEKGQLVAIAVAGMSKDVTEGLNFGIKSSAAANFLKSNKISPSAGYMSFSMDDDKLVKLLEKSTVYTFCN